MSKFHIHTLSRRSYSRTVFWSVLLCVSIVVAAAALGRATHNFSAALTDKPDVALYLLLPEEGIGRTTLLRESEEERDYLAETETGPKLIKLRRADGRWYVSLIEKLHEER